MKRFIRLEDPAFVGILLIVIIALLLIGVSTYTAHGQDATPEPTPAPVVTPIPLPDAGNTILNDVITIIASYGAVVGTAGAILVGFAKYIPGVNSLSAPTLSVVVNGLLVVGLWIATHYGLADQYQSGLAQVQTVGAALLAFVSAVLGSGLIHTQAAKAKVPVVGYQRTPKA